MSDFNNIRFQPQRPLLRELSADRLNTILQEIKRNKPRGERGITVRQDGNGTYIGLAASLPRGGGGASVAPQPWDLVPRIDPESDPENPSYLIRVRPGTITGVLPTNWDDEFSANNEGLYYAVASVSVGTEGVSAVEISISTDQPAQPTAELWSVSSPVEYLFGLFLEGRAYRVIGTGSPVLLPRVYLTKPLDEPAEPGELPYEQYYIVA
jgi:hypothetical protein